MSDARTINAAMSALIDGTFGCLDAAAETINARLGGQVGKGTLSKYLSGQLQWPLAYVWALEDAAGRYPVTRMMARRLSPDGNRASGHLFEHAGVISKESGEAVAAILAAQQSDTARDTGQAIVEVDEAIEALTAARSKLAGCP
ncbi:hypothetical protein SAMN05216376_105208 [Mameliella alba]|uniref:hypothetical protein n=1 Tax=Mameliella TaxID=1434019 RepID=UPI0008869345|nr:MULTISPECIES: hypothetical protein [Mameliella]MDD9731589.1 hypothetical protein [Mameliella sp. AT18]OWV48258.1 hypothetical protein CDZ96_10600 [Mameliella alba]PTR40299.1 hypothetical protein LX94_01781 [Mameliella alba]SDC98642.1 hypothetical protein SAMN05216376_105208 [Mameliella alba]GGF43869.1 hypothetical protein GCM10011319_02090 [Mameliella alba]